MTTSNDFDNALQAALGPAFSVSVTLGEEDHGYRLDILVTHRWWAWPLWWMRRRATYALIHALIPNMAWTLERRARWW